MFQNGITKRISLLDEAGATVESLQALLKVDDDESLLQSLLLVATEYAERYLSRTIVSGTWMRQFDGPASRGGLQREDKMLRWAYLPYPPLVSVDKVYSLDTDGNKSDITGYYVDEGSTPARLVFTETFGGRSVAQVRIEYTCGYGGEYASGVPYLIQQGILQHAAYMYEHRGDCGAEQAAKLSGAIGTYGMYRVGLV